jgi:hypothetical protein
MFRLNWPSSGVQVVTVKDSLIGHYMFRPNWPSSDVEEAIVKDSAAHCNAVFYPPIVVVVAPGYFQRRCT